MFSRFDTIPAVTDRHPASHVAVANTLYAIASRLNNASWLVIVSARFICLTNTLNKQEAQLMLTTGSTHLVVSRGQQTWYHSTCYI